MIEKNKPIRLIELFAGIGSQAKALKNLGANFEHYKISEWEVNAAASYKAIHKENDTTDYSVGIASEELTEILFNIGISTDGKKLMSLKEINRKGEQWKRMVYNNFKATNNIGSILNVSGSDLGIVDTDKYTYVLTYSFPCQDLSNAGRGAGMEKGSGTRSGLLWEVERLLNECDELPQILLMENVPQVHAKKNLEDFNKWISFLESKGYSNFWQDLNAKDYGVPQNRNRCVMVSFLCKRSYTFPKPMPLNKTLGDLLDEEVEQHYYLTEEKCHKIANWKSQQNPLERVNGSNSISPTLTARGAGEYHSGMVLVSPYLKNTANLRGSILQREVCSKAVDITKPYEMIDYTYSNARLKEIQEGGVTVRNKNDSSISCTLTTQPYNFAVRIPDDMFRVLTPIESWRLMGFDDADFEKAAQVCDSAQLYKQAGNSIVVNVLMAIFKELFMKEV